MLEYERIHVLEEEVDVNKSNGKSKEYDFCH